MANPGTDETPEEERHSPEPASSARDQVIGQRASAGMASRRKGAGSAETLSPLAQLKATVSDALEIKRSGMEMHTIENGPYITFEDLVGALNTQIVSERVRKALRPCVSLSLGI